MEDSEVFDAWKRCWTERFADFGGRSSRSEYWNFMFVNILIFVGLILLMIISTSIVASQSQNFYLSEAVSLFFRFVILLVSALSLIPSLSAGIRRLHDTGRSGSTYIVGFIPLIGWLILLVFLCQESLPGENQWGENPEDERCEL